MLFGVSVLVRYRKSTCLCIYFTLFIQIAYIDLESALLLFGIVSTIRFTDTDDITTSTNYTRPKQNCSLRLEQEITWTMAWSKRNNSIHVYTFSSVHTFITFHNWKTSLVCLSVFELICEMMTRHLLRLHITKYAQYTKHNDHIGPLLHGSIHRTPSGYSCQ